MNGSPDGICGTDEHTTCKVTGDWVAQSPTMIATIAIKPR